MQLACYHLNGQKQIMKGLQLKVGAKRAPRLLIKNICQQNQINKKKYARRNLVNLDSEFVS